MNAHVSSLNTIPDGVLLINKQAGMTSHDVVNKVRRLYQTKQVGHTGTLDPMATGLLILLIGRAVKASEYLSCDRKRYLATLRLGITTDTEDTTGTILSTTAELPPFETVRQVLPRFTGKIQQVPPMYSALKVNGRKLVDLARQGLTIERQAREIEIFDLKAAPTDADTDIALDVTCSGGTYIRTLCADIGTALGCGGSMASLCRTEVASFSLRNAHTLGEVESMKEEARLSLLIPTEQLFANLLAIRLGAFHEKLIRSGCAITQQKLHADLLIGTRVRLLTERGLFFALGQAVADETQGSSIRAIKTFVI